MEDMIRFPHLGIVLSHVGSGIQIGSFEIAFYGIIVAAGMLAGIRMAMWIAKHTGQDPDLYFNFAFIGITAALVGARLYYVVFSWDYYRKDLLQILNLRGGGLAIYGGVIGAVLSCLIYTKWKKLHTLLVFDTACVGLLAGQAIGRWGNFFNREAFGDYTDSLFAMQLPVTAVSSDEITQRMAEHIVSINGTDFIQVHPTFLYESFWNLAVLILLIFVTKKGLKRFHGEIFLLYMIGYASGRVWIEGLRTDQLHWPGTGIAVSQVLAAGILLVCIPLLVYFRMKNKKKSGEVQLWQ